MTGESAAHEIAKNLLSLISNQQAQGHTTTAESIRALLQAAEITYNISHGLPPAESLDGLDRDGICRWVESQITVSQEEAKRLVDSSHQPWLFQHRADIAWRYWKDYQKILERDLAPAAAHRLDETTDEILDLIPNPRRRGQWDTRGLVMGNVQSGKTANYLGLICKAADAGYRVVIVLTGLHNDLRSQTQERLDEGFVGRDTRNGFLHAPLCGVGLWQTAPMPFTFTSRMHNGDFSTTAAQSVGVPLDSDSVKVFVVKKNSTVLKNLIEWLKTAAPNPDSHDRIPGIPLLLIDDEADQASVNTSDAWDPDDEDHWATTINKRIRTILQLFDQSAYVGYTATPFANIFIPTGGESGPHGEDLFPRNFIVALEAPSDHIGPETLFGLSTQDDGEESDGLPLTRVVEGSNKWIPPKHKATHRIDKDLPDSLIEAIDSFILVCAARLLRMGDRIHHNSMLVHVTRFIDIQEQVATQIKNHLEELIGNLEVDNSAVPEVRERLRHLWERDFIPTSRHIAESSAHGVGTIHQFDEVAPHIRRVASRIETKILNGNSKDALDYVDSDGVGCSFIAIGGDRLSRGLTLKGLAVSYYARPSRMYDTLMQMGRWFGYRPGYLDLCRLYTTSEISEWYRAIALAVNELTAEFREMAELGGTPTDFGLRVRHHPDLMVTNRTKLRTGAMRQVTFSRGRAEVTTFEPSDRTSDFKDAELLVTELLEEYGPPDRPDPDGKGDFSWNGVAPKPVVSYLRRLEFRDAYSRSKSVEPKYLADYIEKVSQDGGLREWTILVKSKRDPETSSKIADLDIGLAFRSNQIKTPEGASSSEYYSIKSLIGSADEAFDLTEAEKSDARSQIGDDRLLTGRHIRRHRPRTRGLLILYFLEGDPSLGKLIQNPYTAFCMSFPDDGVAGGEIVYYYVNSVWQETE